MAITHQFDEILALLKIRRAAYRRNMILAGVLFLIAIFSTLAVGFLAGLSEPSVYLVTALDIVFAATFLMAFIRLEIINGNIELIDNLQIRDR